MAKWSVAAALLLAMGAAACRRLAERGESALSAAD